MRPEKNVAFTVVLLGALLCPSAAPQVLGNESLYAEKKVYLLLRALSYDRKLMQRVQTQNKGAQGEFASHFCVLVLHKTGFESEAQGIASSFNTIGEKGVATLPLMAKTGAFSSVGDLLSKIRTEGHNVLYVHSSLEGALSSVQQVSRSLKVPSIGGSSSMVEKGLSLGVSQNQDDFRLLVNLRASRVEGMDLKAELLKVSTVIR